MRREWQITTLGAIVEFQSGGTPSKSNAGYWIGTTPWVSAKDMKRLFVDDTEDHISAEAIEDGAKIVPANTVLMLTRGMTLLHDVPICIVRKPMSFNQDVKAIRPTGAIDSRFLPYLLLGSKHRLLGMVDLAGHGTGRLNTEELKKLDVLLPPMPEQQAIAQILCSFDDKIDLNRRMNDTLEAMTRTLFKSWFVDFDPVRAKAEEREPPGIDSATASLFPSRFQDSSLGPIPAGWRVGTVADIATLSRSGLNPGDFPTEVFDHYSIPAFDQGRVAVAEQGGVIKSNKFVVSADAVLLSKLNPRIDRAWIPDLTPNRRSICSTEFLVFQPRPPFSREWIAGLVRSAAFRDVYCSLVTGTSGSHQRVQPDALLGVSVVVPDATLVQRFHEVALPIQSRIAVNTRESGTLATMRNALLPRLLSGELVLPDTLPAEGVAE